MDGLTLVMAVPFEDFRAFLSQPKMNSMPVKGYVEIGSRIFEFSPKTPSRFSTGAGEYGLQVPLVLGKRTTRLEDAPCSALKSAGLAT